MTDFWQVGPAEAERRLRLAGFSVREAEGLVALRLHCEAVDVRTLSEEQRLALLRWLLEHGRRDEGWPTAREVEVLRLVDEGHRNRDIATRLRIRETTVQFHLRNLFRKLGAASRVQMIHLARQRGWIE